MSEDLFQYLWKMKFRRTHLTANSKQINKRRPPPTIPTSNASNIKTNQIQSSSHRPRLRTRATSNRLHRLLRSQYKTVRVPRIKRPEHPKQAVKRVQPNHRTAGIRRRASVPVWALSERLSSKQTLPSEWIPSPCSAQTENKQIKKLRVVATRAKQHMRPKSAVISHFCRRKELTIDCVCDGKLDC